MISANIGGLLRRAVGVAGVALVYFGYLDQAGADTLATNIAGLVGSAMAIFDLGKSVFDKLPFGKK